MRRWLMYIIIPALISTGLCLFLPNPAGSEPPGDKELPVETIPVKLPPRRDVTLDNGLAVSVVEMHEVPLVSFMLVIPAGSVFDPPGREGLASYTARLLDKGAGDMGAEEISGAIAGVGGELTVSAGSDFAVVRGDFLSEDISTALKLAGKMVRAPRFFPEEIEQQRSIILADIESGRESPYSLASREFRSFLLGGHPYSDPVDGYRSTVEGISREEITGFYHKHYRPEGSVLAVAGDIETEDIIKSAGEIFGNWKGKRVEEDIDSLLINMHDGGKRKILVINRRDVTQSQIRTGNIAIGRGSSHYFPLLVANTILGGGFTSRLMEEIRVKRGLSYGAGSYLSRFRWGGYFSVYTYTKHSTLRETIDVALTQLERIRNETVSEEELDKAARYLCGLFPFRAETSMDVAGWLARINFYNLNENFVENYNAAVNRVSREDVRQAAERFFCPCNCPMVILTNYQETADQMEGLGDITIRDMDELY